MNACTKVVTLLDAMVESVRQDAGVEKGFILCRMPDGSLAKGATCGGDGDPLADSHRCTTEDPFCPPGGVPVASFHTHPTSLPDRMPRGEAAKALLIPSVMDFRADREIGVDVGCVGGHLNDGRGFVWCFPRRRGVDVTVSGIWDALRAKEAKLLGTLAQFYSAMGNPCLEVYFPIEAEPCPTCGHTGR